jgi:hypothetical protein
MQPEATTHALPDVSPSLEEASVYILQFPCVLSSIGMTTVQSTYHRLNARPPPTHTQTHTQQLEVPHNLIICVQLVTMQNLKNLVQSLNTMPK